MTKLPLIDDLFADPHLAVLALVDTSAHVAVRALAAAYPELQDFDDDTDDLELHTALAVIDAAGALVASVNRHRIALVVRRKRDPTIPF